SGVRHRGALGLMWQVLLALLARESLWFWRYCGHTEVGEHLLVDGVSHALVDLAHMGIPVDPTCQMRVANLGLGGLCEGAIGVFRSVTLGDEGVPEVGAILLVHLSSQRGGDNWLVCNFGMLIEKPLERQDAR